MKKIRTGPAPLPAFALLLLALCACARGGLGSFGTSIDGRDAERAIDGRLTPMLKNANPQMTVAKAVCPDRLDLSSGKAGRCSLTVDGTPVPVKVVAATDGRRGFSVSLDGNVYVSARLDQYLDALLAKGYGAKAAAHCEPPSIRAVATGTSFRCPVSGASKLASVELRALASGQIAVDSPPDLELAEGGWVNDAVRAHKAKRPVVVSGADVAEKIDELLSAQMRASGEASSLGATRCPARVVLTGAAQAICRVPFHGQNMRVALWIEDDVDGFHVERLDVAINKPLVQQVAQNELNARLQQKGTLASVVVDCGPGYVVVTPGDSFYCKLTVTGGTGRLQVTVKDAKGRVKWRAVDLKGAGPSLPLLGSGSDSQPQGRVLPLHPSLHGAPPLQSNPLSPQGAPAPPLQQT